MSFSRWVLHMDRCPWPASRQARRRDGIPASRLHIVRQRKTALWLSHLYLAENSRNLRRQHVLSRRVSAGKASIPSWPAMFAPLYARGGVAGGKGSR
jgi:hypothetical protein